MTKRASVVDVDGRPLPVPVPKKKFSPTGDKVILHVIPADDLTEGGLALPDGAVKDNWKTPMAWVVACGPQCKQVKPGDKVLVTNTQQVYKVRHDGDELVMLAEDAILGVIDGEHTPPE